MQLIRPQLVLFLLISSTGAFGQPNPYGCHFFRHGHGPLTVNSDRAEIDDTIARSDTFDILHYEIHLDVTDYVGGRIKAATRIEFVPLMADLSFIRFDLRDLQVDSVVGPNGTLQFAQEPRFLRVDLEVSPAIGEMTELTVHYQGEPYRDPDWGGFYFESNYMYNLGIGLSTIPPNFGKVWYPCFDSFVERATYAYHVKSAGTFRCHGQGDLLGEVQLEGDTVIRSYDFPYAIPTHLSAIAVAAYTDHEYVHTGANGDVPVRLTAKSANLSAMIGRFGDLGAAIDVCEYWYGPYPYGRVGYVLTTDGALEIPTNIAYPQFMSTQNILNNRGLFTHELGHHWWGDVVTPHVHNDMWLKEGPAEYSGHLIEEWIGGAVPFLKAVKDNHYYVLREAHLNDGGFQPLSPMPDPYIYGTHTYYKGASVMHNLRGYLGDELFRSALRGIQVDLAETTITAVGFKEALENESGIDLDPFFDAQVFAPGFAAFEVRGMELLPGGPNTVVDLEIGQKLRGTSGYHNEVPLDVTFIGADGQLDEQHIIATGALTNVELQVPFAPEMVVLNRYNRLNQARMDHEITLIPGVGFSNLMPYVDFRLYSTTLVDTTLVRVDHIWSGPDQTPLDPDVLAISGTHYWNVDGLWPEGTVLRGRLYYYGQDPLQFDYDLLAGDESGIAVLYRPNAQVAWSVYADQVVTAGNLTNGNGYITMENLRKGQYAFGKIAGFIGVQEVVDAPLTLQVGPVPATDVLDISGTFDGQGRLWFDVINMDGRALVRDRIDVFGTFKKTLDLSTLAAGNYILQVSDGRSLVKMERRFQVIR